MEKEKTGDTEILHSRQIGKRMNPNKWDTSAKAGAQLIFS